MSEYIKREDAIEAVSHDGQVFKSVLAIEHIPSADVVEVVRCKDCKWAEVHKRDNGVFCEYNECGFEKNDYCSYGERKDNEDK